MSGVKIEINLDSCNSCKMCFNVCFVDVFRWDEEQEQPIVAYPEDCVWCLACEEACTGQCIEVIPIIPVSIKDPY